MSESLFDRAAFDLEPGTLWVMHCAEGPVPRAAAAAVNEFMGKELRPWTARWPEDFTGPGDALRRLGARVLGGAPDALTPTPTTTSGLVTVAQGFPWAPGDEVVAPLGEFPSNAWPWLALAPRGVTFREVPLWDGHLSGPDAWRGTPPPPGCDPEARLVAALGPRTRVLAVSWVRFQDGLRLDLARLGAACAARGVALVVDGIQGAGTLPVTLDEACGVAAFATGGHKGLLGPQGLGLLWTASGFRARLAPPGGWLSVDDAMNFERANTDFARTWVADGRRFEQGVPNLVATVALLPGLEVIAETGPARIAAHVAALQRELCGALASDAEWDGEAARSAALLDAGRLGSILALHHHGRGAEWLQRVLRAAAARRVYASIREGYLRIALHGWHDSADVARLAEWLRSAA